MYALVIDKKVIEISVVNYWVSKPMFWVDIADRHGEVDSDMFYDKDKDTFMRPVLVYAKNPNTHEDHLQSPNDQVPDTHTLIDRDPWSIWSEADNTFVRVPEKVDSALKKEQEHRLKTLSEKCGLDIENGFICDAIGTDEKYRCNRDDQQRIRVAAETPKGGGIWIGGTYTFHSQEQAIIVHERACDHIETITKEYSDNCSKVNNATIDSIFTLNF